ncbi:hypothetical protein D9601_01775 [Sphingomonas sp. MA1305]|uniref:hypothetical protein n=1 Tax=unclassified Sphingomonas TaxID=196159 RepID=UPI0018E02A03|nr:hypothetical protein [Sphingomonas sp. MA1305]MBI0474095.1 hypothetical protein [Sphingomonas sp. MA1305]
MSDAPSKSAAFYRHQAAEQHRAAGEAVLENVRERCSRAAASWEAMAARADLAERRRESQRTPPVIVERPR